MTSSDGPRMKRRSSEPELVQECREGCGRFKSVVDREALMVSILQ
jgi:hypothetical protein